MKLFNRRSEGSGFDARVLPGVPSVFTGRDTTYGEVRRMARDMAERDWRTQAEKGLAMTLLAVVEDFKQELETRDEAK